MDERERVVGITVEDDDDDDGDNGNDEVVEEEVRVEVGVEEDSVNEETTKGVLSPGFPPSFVWLPSFCCCCCCC